LKNRSRTEIAAQIVEAAVGGASKSKILYRAFLSYQQLNQYLALLVKNGLLDYDQRTNKFRTTQKGAKFLKIYGQLGKTR
jgi:predicted transcriptional regulator